MERKDDKSFKRDIIVLISVPIHFVSTSFLVNIGQEMSLPGFRIKQMFLLFSVRVALGKYCSFGLLCVSVVNVITLCLCFPQRFCGEDVGFDFISS